VSGLTGVVRLVRPFGPPRREAAPAPVRRTAFLPALDVGPVELPVFRSMTAVAVPAPIPWPGPPVASPDAPAAPPDAVARRRRGLPWWLQLPLFAGFLLAVTFLAPRGLAWLLDSEYPMASVTSSSMWPNLKKGDLIFIQGVDDRADLRVGDIIAFKHRSGFVIHRIVEIDGGTITTQGDANDERDDPITFDEVIGRPVKAGDHLLKIPHLGNIPRLFGQASDVNEAGTNATPVDGASGLEADGGTP